MRPKHDKSDARILGEIRRLRHLLEHRRLARTEAALVAAEREIETLRAQLRGLTAPVATTTPESETGGDQ